MFAEEIILEIENTPIKCKKQDLITNSDYFKVMFEGNFVEKDKNVVQIQGVDLKAINIILTLLWDNTYYIEDEDVFSVLQAASMLQFCKIQNVCVDKLTKILSPKNCLKTWIITEQLALKPLYLKAKYLALTEFMVIRETDVILELTLEQIHNYLGNVNLRTDKELSVFQTLMKWWYENNETCDKSKDLLKLVSCVNFKQLTKDHFKEILTYPDIANNEVGDILTCCYNNKNKISTEMFSEKCRLTAALLDKTNSRKVESYPCILVGLSYDPEAAKKAKLEVEQVIYYDKTSGQFKKLLNTMQTLEGCTLIGYKEYVFMYGGEYLLGRGEWNYGFWAYDSIRENWQKKSTLPFPRRHFETCTFNSKIFIAAGTGPFRINQENIFWYDFIEDQWSKLTPLPVFDRQLKCCDFLNKFLIFSISNKLAYFFEDLNFWLPVPIVADPDILNMQLDFSIFSYNNRLFVKGKKLVEFTLKRYLLVVLSTKHITDLDYEKIETTVCNNLVYTLYKYQLEDKVNYCLEKYDLETDEKVFIFKNLSKREVIQAEDDNFHVDPALKMFSFSHYTLVEGNELINEQF